MEGLDNAAWILNCHDPGVKIEVAKKHNVTEEEYLKAREMILLAAVLQNKTAFNMLADYVYTEINKGATNSPLIIEELKPRRISPSLYY